MRNRNTNVDTEPNNKIVMCNTECNVWDLGCTVQGSEREYTYSVLTTQSSSGSRGAHTSHTFATGFNKMIS